MSVDHDVAAVRAALLPAVARDARRGRRRRLRFAAPAALVLVLGSTAVAAATGVIFSAPKVDESVPRRRGVDLLLAATRTGTAADRC